jgi:hypothetical protein
MFRSFRELICDVPLEDEDTAIEEIAQRAVRDGMGTAAIVFLESAKPISFLTGQAAIAATPFLGGFIEPMRVERYADLFSNRDFIERLIQRIEELEAERAGARKRHGESS